MTEPQDKLEFVNFELFDFQHEEVLRLYKQKSRLLGWEMGTGKTYGGIALDVENRGRSLQADPENPYPRKTLVVAPKSVLDVWDEHCMELTEEDVYVIDTKDRDKFLRDVRNPNRSGYFIIHWEGVRLLRDELSKIKFFHIIADECHRAKNRKAQQTLALKAIPTLYKTAMSGTPADNKPDDLWSILNWLWPTVYRGYWNFRKAYIAEEVDYRADGEPYTKLAGVKNAEHLHAQMEPWYSRKLKKDVLKDLPDKYYTTLWVDLHPKQRKAYDQMQKTMVAWVEDYIEDAGTPTPLIAQVVVSQIVRLQQFGIGYMVPRLDADGNQMYGKPYTTKSGIDKPGPPLFKMTEPSSKLDTLVETLKDNPDESIVVFSQFKPAVTLLGARLAEVGISHGLYTGDTSQKDRGQLVRSFQAGETRVFAGTIAAGGEGITLTKSSTVVFLDRTWSPSRNAQGEDRCHRIGQRNAVQVIDIMAKGTLDLGRKNMLAEKMGWLREILGDRIADTLEGKA